MNKFPSRRTDWLHCAAVATALAVLLATQIVTAWAFNGLLLG